jgi:hypothetical protein
MNFGSKDNGGTCSSRLPQRLRDESEETPENIQDANIETNLEFVPRPRRWELSLVAYWLRPKPAKMAPFLAGADIRVRQAQRKGA